MLPKFRLPAAATRMRLSSSSGSCSMGKGGPPLMAGGALAAVRAKIYDSKLANWRHTPVILPYKSNASTTPAQEHMAAATIRQHSVAAAAAVVSW